jgi:hypothetical protein
VQLIIQHLLTLLLILGGDEGNIKVSKTKMSSFMAACVHEMSNTNFYFQIHLVRSKKYTILLRMIW